MARTPTYRVAAPAIDRRRRVIGRRPDPVETPSENERRREREAVALIAGQMANEAIEAERARRALTVSRLVFELLAALPLLFQGILF